MEIEKIAQEKTEMQRHYVMVSDMIIACVFVYACACVGVCGLVALFLRLGRCRVMCVELRSFCVQ